MLRGKSFADRFGLMARFSILSFVAIVAVSALLAWQISRRMEDQAIQDAADSTASFVAPQIINHLRPGDFQTPLVGPRYDDLRTFIQQNIVSDRVAALRLWSVDGQIIYCDDQAMVGRRFPIDDAHLSSALKGQITADISSLDGPENLPERLRYDKLLEVYVPVRFSGQESVAGVFEIYLTYSPIAGSIQDIQRLVLSWLGVGALVMYVMLLVIVKGASNTIIRQNKNLLALHSEVGTAYQRVKESHISTLEALAAAIDARDPYTYGHSQRVTHYALSLAQELNYSGVDSEAALETLRRAGLLHDLGKIGIADAILLKPAKLTQEEYAEMKRHAEKGFRMLQSVPFLQEELSLIRHHHERYDGLGYPNGLKGEDIPLGARILCVADALEAMTSDRHYRQALTLAAAREQLLENSGTQFCPEVVRITMKLLDDELVSGEKRAILPGVLPVLAPS
ncbi:MAG: HD-GYP domain-containing protein [Chloroflexi bacterium]|nr:HD-GYP domain-containing protein [Chloroflexota bacterium]